MLELYTPSVGGDSYGYGGSGYGDSDIYGDGVSYGYIGGSGTNVYGNGFGNSNGGIRLPWSLTC